MVGKTKHRTKLDDARFDAMNQIRCIPCYVDGTAGMMPSVQHTTSGGRREKDQHQCTYRSCWWHHLGQTMGMFGGSVREMTNHYGPSFHHDKTAFAERYGTEDQLVRVQDVLVDSIQMAARQGEFFPDEVLIQMTQDVHRQIVND